MSAPLTPGEEEWYRGFVKGPASLDDNTRVAIRRLLATLDAERSVRADLRAALATARDIIEANIAEDSCRHSRYVETKPAPRTDPGTEAVSDVTDETRAAQDAYDASLPDDNGMPQLRLRPVGDRPLFPGDPNYPEPDRDTEVRRIMELVEIAPDDDLGRDYAEALYEAGLRSGEPRSPEPPLDVERLALAMAHANWWDPDSNTEQAAGRIAAAYARLTSEGEGGR